MAQQPNQGDIAQRNIAPPFSASFPRSKSRSLPGRFRFGNRLRVLSVNTHTRLHNRPTPLYSMCKRVLERSSRCYTLALQEAAYQDDRVMGPIALRHENKQQFFVGSRIDHTGNNREENLTAENLIKKYLLILNSEAGMRGVRWEKVTFTLVLKSSVPHHFLV